MKITETEVRYVANLGNLELSAMELARMAKDLDSILTHMDKLNELDVSQVEPMSQVLYEAGATATLAADEIAGTLGAATATANASLSGAGFFKVPKVIER